MHKGPHFQIIQVSRSSLKTCVWLMECNRRRVFSLKLVNIYIWQAKKQVQNSGFSWEFFLFHQGRDPLANLLLGKKRQQVQELVSKMPYFSGWKLGGPHVSTGHLGDWLWVQLHTTAAFICQVFCQKGRPNIFFFPHSGHVLLSSLCAGLAVYSGFWLSSFISLTKNVNYLPLIFLCSVSWIPSTQAQKTSQHQGERREKSRPVLGAGRGGRTGKRTKCHIGRRYQEILPSVAIYRLNARIPTATGNVLRI